MEATALSLAARALRGQLAAALALDEGQIFIGHPAAAHQKVEGQADKQFLNIFFYRIEPSGYPADAAAADPTYLRAYCLVTAFGTDEGNASARVTAGENDLKLIGGVLATLHQHPVLTINDAASGSAVALQVIPAPFTVENIYNLWSTQASTAYRPSVAYELALLPAPFAQAVERSPLVGGVGLDVAAAGAARRGRADAAAPPAWVPELRFASVRGLDQVLAFSAAEAPAALDVAVAGRTGARVTLRWRIWTPAAGWRAAAAEEDVSVTIDSETVAEAAPRAVPLPPAAPGAERRQLTLAAVFEPPPGPAGAPGAVSSNLLLVSLFGEAAP